MNSFNGFFKLILSSYEDSSQVQKDQIQGTYKARIFFLSHFNIAKVSIFEGKEEQVEGNKGESAKEYGVFRKNRGREMHVY